MGTAAPVLLIACGALANEIVALSKMNRWTHFEVQCLPAEYHNRPNLIAPAVQQKLAEQTDQQRPVLVAYADCGTGGDLDRVLVQYPGPIERLPGAHCYEFFSGADLFRQWNEEEFGTFYLTDFLLRHFDRIVVRGLGIDRHPELQAMYFGNYTRLMYLAQVVTPERIRAGQVAADRLGLKYEYRETGYGDLATSMGQVVSMHEKGVKWQN